jgi:RimJ/RimL family protein N-acetyltransferase
MQNPYLIGNKIYLRALEPADVPLLVTWFNDGDITRYLARYRPMTVGQELAFLKQLDENDKDCALGMVLRETDQLIGTAGLMNLDVRHRHTAFGISIGDKTMWNKGYGTETTRLLLRHAFHTLNLNRVWLRVYEFNAGAIRCYEKGGFRVEGRLRQDFFGEGRYWDTIVMGILRDEWRAPE